ncbi:carbon-nitrogen hydrolase family protein [Corynebacterium timonense]|uniref:Predicted amidohydrolase n=1 Tax=Corynebacterium timonense TaxID=441500 RepID=A0A1H1VJG0_9CORY|nr:carbon-nitrogen hydrolase family protein [Corynebacterium timonense]SDS84481.1 Predicted amidohydrolase [Corynebacterium timonense]
MKIALLQLTSTGDKSENLALVEPKIRQAAGQGASLVVLPEATMQAFDNGRLDTQAEELDGDFATALRELAAELGVTIVVGMFRPADTHKERNRVYNTALITGNGMHRGYDKIHTFDAFDYRESDTVKPGEALVTFEHEGAVVGVATCYDIRFPEQFKELARRGADIVVVPTSWADGEGKRHQWRTLTVARALDAGVFIAAACQARPGGEAKAGQASGPTGIGHSVVVSPTGERLAESGYGEDLLVVDIDPADAARARRALPLL